MARTELRDNAIHGRLSLREVDEVDGGERPRKVRGAVAGELLVGEIGDIGEQAHLRRPAEQRRILRLLRLLALGDQVRVQQQRGVDCATGDLREVIGPPEQLRPAAFSGDPVQRIPARTVAQVDFDCVPIVFD